MTSDSSGPPAPEPQCSETACVAAAYIIIIIIYHNLNIPSLRIRPGLSSAEQQAVCLVAQPQRYLTLSRIPSGGWPFMWSSSEEMWFARSKLLHNPAPHDMTIFSSLSISIVLYILSLLYRLRLFITHKSYYIMNAAPCPYEICHHFSSMLNWDLKPLPKPWCLMMMLFVLIYRMFNTGETHENLVEDMKDRLLAAHFYPVWSIDKCSKTMSFLFVYTWGSQSEWCVGRNICLSTHRQSSKNYIEECIVWLTMNITNDVDVFNNLMNDLTATFIHITRSNCSQDQTRRSRNFQTAGRSTNYFAFCTLGSSLIYRLVNFLFYPQTESQKFTWYTKNITDNAEVFSIANLLTWLRFIAAKLKLMCMRVLSGYFSQSDTQIWLVCDSVRINEQTPLRHML